MSYVERFTVTPCSEKLIATHSVSPLRIREDLVPWKEALPVERPEGLIQQADDACCMASEGGVNVNSGIQFIIDDVSLLRTCSGCCVDSERALIYALGTLTLVSRYNIVHTVLYSLAQ